MRLRLASLGGLAGLLVAGFLSGTTPAAAGGCGYYGCYAPAPVVQPYYYQSCSCCSCGGAGYYGGGYAYGSYGYPAYGGYGYGGYGGYDDYAAGVVVGAPYPYGRRRGGWIGY